MSIIEYIRHRWRKDSLKADYENSRASAIKLHCLECCYAQKSSVKQCERLECFLWPYRLGPVQERTPNLPWEVSTNVTAQIARIPSREVQEFEIESAITDAQRENGKRLRDSHKNS